MSNHNKPPRTPEQKEALREAYELLTAQFHDVLIVCGTREDHDPAAQATDLEIYWQGGWIAAHVLAEFAKQRLNYQRRNRCAPS
jgi:alpha-mannosidase